jgi:c-di-GMP-binding flagellar brake protein YcgR
MERRRDKRVYAGIPMNYQVQVQEDPEVSWKSSGVVENISHGGLYFRSDDIPPLKEGQLRDFTFTSTKEHPDYPETDFIVAKGRIVRIDPPEPGQENTGVALEFFWVKFIGDFRDKSI